MAFAIARPRARSWCGLIARSRFGRSLIAVRDHEAAASSVGINLAHEGARVRAERALRRDRRLAVGARRQNAASADKVETFQNSIEFLVAVVIGGTATVLGPLIGGFAVVYIEKWATDAFPSKPVVSPATFGIVLIVLHVRAPRRRGRRRAPAPRLAGRTLRSRRDAHRRVPRPCDRT